jgi:citrate lyase beta subunit
MSDRLRRSLLYVPASAEAMLRKAGGRGADVLILDLEDGVHPDAKDEARARLARLYRDLDFGRSEALVRVNPPGSPWHERDVEMAAALRPAGVVLPKAADPEALARLDARLGVALWLMIETAAGLLRAAELARAPRVAALVFGAADFRESLRAGRHPEELELHVARSQLLVAARAAEVEAFDTPWFEYRDADGLRRSAERARLLGFDGKSAIHPGQLALIHEVFAPRPAEIERARRVIAALDEAAARGLGVAVLDGEMIEALHGRGARRTLARAGTTRERGGPLEREA